MEVCHLLKPRRPPDFIKFLLPQLEDMQENQMLPHKNYQQVGIDIGLMKEKKKINSHISMQESQVENKNLILKDKLISSKDNSQEHPFSLILDLVSTTKEKTLKPFFNFSYKVKSKKLWLPTKTDSQESGLNSFSGSFNSLDQNLFLWTQNNFLKHQEMKCLMTSWKLSLSSQPDIMEVENIENTEKVLRCKKIPFIPKGNMLFFIRKNFDIFEKYYNLAIDEINKRYENKKIQFNNSITCIKCKKNKEENSWFCKKHINSKIKWNLNINNKSIRETLKIKNENVSEEDKEVLYDVRNNALRSAISAYKTSCSLMKNKKIEHFNLKRK